MEACRDGHTETVETLLAEATVDVNIANEVITLFPTNLLAAEFWQDGWTALVHAVYGGHTDTVRVLLGDNRVKVNEKTNVRFVSTACNCCVLIPKCRMVALHWIGREIERRLRLRQCSKEREHLASGNCGSTGSRQYVR